MIDFTNKCVITESDVESAKLLKMAISQGFALPKGEKVMESCRFFRFMDRKNCRMCVCGLFFRRYVTA